jgi:energy-coupling factor transport system ATP-binding protein
VWEDVAFGLENLGYESDEVVKITDKALERLALTKYSDFHPFRLGKGDRQRVAFASILVMNPKILIVDEPTTGQDPEKAREVMRLLVELNQERGITVIVVTHAMELVAEFTNRVIVMGVGEVLLDGSPREVFSQSELLAKTYIQPPQIARLGLMYNLQPLPLTVSEAALAFKELHEREKIK